jgi:hypothetical protein
MDNYEEEEENAATRFGRIVGSFIGVVLGMVVLLSLTALILLLGWNYALVQTTPVGEIKYFQCLLLVFTLRSLAAMTTMKLST